MIHHRVVLKPVRPNLIATHPGPNLRAAIHSLSPNSLAVQVRPNPLLKLSHGLSLTVLPRPTLGLSRNPSRHMKNPT
jgi:hypothetical protein